MLDRIKFDTVTTVSKIQVRSQAEIEREELERQQRLARALQMQHAEAISPIQLGAALEERVPALRAPPGSIHAAGEPGAGGRWSLGRCALRVWRPSCGKCRRWGATSSVPAAPAKNTNTVTAPCSKRAVDPPRG